MVLPEEVVLVPKGEVVPWLVVVVVVANDAADTNPRCEGIFVLLFERDEDGRENIIVTTITITTGTNSLCCRLPLKVLFNFLDRSES
jgi:hypothetical protein